MQGGVRLVVETCDMQEFGKRQRFPENGVQDSRSVGGQIRYLGFSWFCHNFFLSSHNFLVSRPCNLKI